MSKDKEKVAFSLRIDRTIMDSIDEIAEHLGLSRNAVISLVLRDYVSAKGKEVFNEKII